MSEQHSFTEMDLDHVEAAYEASLLEPQVTDTYTRAVLDSVPRLVEALRAAWRELDQEDE
jgi:hypothetical protein